MPNMSMPCRGIYLQSAPLYRHSPPEVVSMYPSDDEPPYRHFSTGVSVYPSDDEAPPLSVRINDTNHQKKSLINMNAYM